MQKNRLSLFLYEIYKRAISIPARAKEPYADYVPPSTEENTMMWCQCQLIFALPTVRYHTDHDAHPFLATTPTQSCARC